MLLLHNHTPNANHFIGVSVTASPVSSRYFEYANKILTALKWLQGTLFQEITIRAFHQRAAKIAVLYFHQPICNELISDYCLCIFMFEE